MEKVTRALQRQRQGAGTVTRRTVTRNQFRGAVVSLALLWIAWVIAPHPHPPSEGEHSAAAPTGSAAPGDGASDGGPYTPRSGAGPRHGSAGALGTEADPLEGPRIWGRVTDPQGRGLPLATLTLLHLPGEVRAELQGEGELLLRSDWRSCLERLGAELEAEGSVETDAEGRFSLALPQAGEEPRWLVIERPRRVSLIAECFDPLPEGAEVEAELHLGAALEVRLEGGGEPLNDPRIEVAVDFAAFPPIRARGPLTFRPWLPKGFGQGPARERRRDTPCRFTGLPPGRVEVFGRAAGYRVARQGLELRPGEGHALTLKLALGLSLTGKVTDLADQPVRDASVELSPMGQVFFDEFDERLPSDAQGNFAFRGLEDQGYRIRVRAPGFKRWSAKIPPGTRELQVTLERELRVSGQVTPPPARGGLDSYTVTLHREGGEAYRDAEARLDDSGGFAFEDVSPGRYELSVSGPKLVTLAPTRIEVSDRDLRGLRLELSPGLRAELRVKDRQGTPLAGVALLEDEDGAPLLDEDGKPSAKSDAEGRLALQGLQPGERQVYLFKPGYARGEALLILAPGRESPATEVVLDPGADLHGICRDAAGEPLDLHWLWLKGPHSRSAKVARSGEFVARGLKPGTYRVTAEVQGNPRELGRVTLAAGQILQAEFTPRPLGQAQVAGRVLRGGRPLADHLVHLNGLGTSLLMAFVSTDAEGRFVIDGLPGGRYGLSARGCPVQEVELGPTQSLKVELQAWEGAVAGRLVLSTGQGAPADLSLSLVSPDPGFDARVTETDGRGDFEFRTVPPGRYRITSRSRFGVVTSAPVELGPRQSRGGLELRYTPGYALELELLRSDGSPAAGVEVSLLARELGVFVVTGSAYRSFDHSAHRADSAGYLHLADLAPGTYALWAKSAGGERGALERLELFAAGGPDRATLRLAAPPTLRVRAPTGTVVEVSCAGRRIASREVPDPGSTPQRTETPGASETRGKRGERWAPDEVVFDDLPPLEVEVQVRSTAGEVSAPRKVRLSPGAVHELDLR